MDEQRELLVSIYRFKPIELLLKGITIHDLELGTNDPVYSYDLIVVEYAGVEMGQLLGGTISVHRSVVFTGMKSQITQKYKSSTLQDWVESSR